jgi:urease accessory protein UreE
MLVERPLENLADIVEAAPTLLDRPIDFVDLSWSQCEQRALRVRTRAGRELRILLRLGLNLKHGDVLQKNSDAVVVVSVLPCEVIVATPTSASQLAAVAFELGNLHTPVQIVEDAQHVITIGDGPAQGVCEKLGVPYVIETRRFEPTLRGVAHTIVGAAEDFALIQK